MSEKSNSISPSGPVEKFFLNHFAKPISEKLSISSQRLILLGWFFIAAAVTFTYTDWTEEYKPVIVGVSLLAFVLVEYLGEFKMGKEFAANTKWLFFFSRSVQHVLIMIVLIRLMPVIQSYLYESLLVTVLTYQAFYIYAYFKDNRAGLSFVKELKWIVLIATVVIISSFSQVNTYEILFFTIYEWLLIILTAVGLAGAIYKIIKVAHLTYGVWLFVGSIIVTALFTSLLFTPLQQTIVLGLYGALYSGKLLRASLIDGLERSTGLFTPLVLIVSFYMESLFPTHTFLIITAYLYFNMFLLTFRSSRKMEE